jgi:hypothetical protein
MVSTIPRLVPGSPSGSYSGGWHWWLCCQLVAVVIAFLSSLVGVCSDVEGITESLPYITLWLPTSIKLLLALLRRHSYRLRVLCASLGALRMRLHTAGRASMK